MANKIQAGREEIQKFLEEVSEKNLDDALHVLLHHGTKENVAKALDLGANVNAQDGHKMTPLMYAAKFGNPEGMAILLERGANTSLRNSEGKTAGDLVEEAQYVVPDKPNQMREVLQEHYRNKPKRIVPDETDIVSSQSRGGFKGKV